MKNSSFPEIFKKTLAIILMAYFSIFSPVMVLAQVTQPVSAPISIPLPVPVPTPTPSPSPTPSPTPTPTTTPKPDLTVDLKAVIDSVGIGTSANLNKKITLTATVKNIGSSSAQPSVTQIKIGNEYPWRIGTNNLGIGTTQALTVITYKTAGTYQISAQADTDAQVSESREDNNTADISVTIPSSLSCNAGDVNFDGKVDTTDARLILRYSAGLEKFSDEQKSRADVNADGAVNVIDSQQILQYFIGKLKTFTACIQKPAPKITAITPSSGIAGSIAAVYGTGFGDKQYLVAFYNQNGQVVEKAPVLGWYDNGVKFRIPAVARGIYSVEVQTANGAKSNRVNFTVTAPQPVVNSIWPAKLKVGNYMVIYGSNLGSSGKINFYNPGSQAASASAVNNYWSNSLIIAKIPLSLKANQQYGIQVRISDGTNLIDSPLVYRYISR